MKVIQSILLSALLAACTPSGITAVGKADFKGKTANEILPAVAGSLVVKLFERVCDENIHDFRRSLALAKSEGYILFAQKDEISIYAHPEGRPFVAFGGGQPSDPELCFVMYREAGNAVSAMHQYVAQQGGKRFDLFPAGSKETIWKANGLNPPRFYIESSNNTPLVGAMSAMAVGVVK